MRWLEWSEVQKESNENYSLFLTTDPDGDGYRVEITPMGDFYACLDKPSKSSFKTKLPSIPMSLLLQALNFFKGVWELYGTEAALQLFYSPDREEYYWYVPEQYVTKYSLDLIRGEQESENVGSWLVMDMHSHGSIPAFFSSTDDADEKGTRLFGVIGNIDTVPRMCLRAGTGGRFIELDQNCIFSVDNTDMMYSSDALLDYMDQVQYVK